MPSTRPGGRAFPVLLTLSAVLLVTTLPSASEVAGQGSGRSGEGRGTRRGLTAITASMGASTTSQTLACSSSFGPSLGASDSALQGIALTAGGAWGVGFERLRYNLRRPVVVRDTPAGWVDVQARSHGTEDGLVAVAADGDDNAWAVGFTTYQQVQYPLVMRWDGARWRVDRPQPPGSLASVLTDVAVVGDGVPWAVGYRMTPDGRRLPVAVRRARRGWDYVSPSVRGRESVTLTGISGDGRGGLWAVGHGGPGTESGPVTFRRANDRWVRYRTPGIRGDAVLTDIVATARDDAWAVGYQQDGPTMRPLVLRWDGRAWRRSRAPRFDSDQAILTAISVAPTGGIWVVGSRWNEGRGTHEAAAAWWDGQAWDEVAGLAGGTELHDVAGAPDADGWAVGRAGVDARVTRVCGRPQASLFGGSEPPGSEEADPLAELIDPVEPGEIDDEEAIEEGPDRDARGTAVFLARKRKDRQRRRTRIRALPEARPSSAVIARDVAAKVGLFESTTTYGAVNADFDGDGQPDLYIGRHGRPGRLMLNERGRFTEHEAMRFSRVDRHGCAAADIDSSGLPDLYCVTGASRGSGLKANELWLDPGSAAPTETAMAAGVLDATGRGRQTAFLRSGRKGRYELVVTNSPVRIDGLPSVGRAWRTGGGGSFAARQRPGFAAGLGGLAMQAVDYDRDGRQDLLLVTGGPQAPMAQGTRIYRNTTAGLQDVTRRLGVDSIDEIDALLVDLDGDRRPDLVQLSQTRLRVSLQRRRGFQRMYERVLTSGRAISAGDADGDGRADLYIVRGQNGHNPADTLLLNRKRGRSFAALTIPQTRAGDGDDAIAIDHDDNGMTDFLVLNGRARPGPTQLIAFYPRD
jgi:FG-GAP-like repeat